MFDDVTGMKATSKSERLLFKDFIIGSSYEIARVGINMIFVLLILSVCFPIYLNFYGDLTVDRFFSFFGWLILIYAFIMLFLYSYNTFLWIVRMRTIRNKSFSWEISESGIKIYNEGKMLSDIPWDFIKYIKKSKSGYRFRINTNSAIYYIPRHLFEESEISIIDEIIANYSP